MDDGLRHIQSAHEVILLGGGLGIICILAGLWFRRFGAPVLLVFLVLGMLAGEDGPGGLVFDDFRISYLVGSVALAVILFEGGLKTELTMLRLAFWPALTLATIGVALTAAIVGAADYLIGGVPLLAALLAGAAVAPTDAAAVAALLRHSGIELPPRVLALLEVESGLNDPMSVFLTLLLIMLISEPGGVSVAHGAAMFAAEMGGGAVLGVAGGAGLVLLLPAAKLEPALAMVLALTYALTLFGAAQSLGTSGFLAVYVAAMLLTSREHPAQREIAHFFEGLAWLAQIVLFLMLGLLVNPHELIPFLPNGLVGAAVLIFVARPLAVFVCLPPFRFSLRDCGFSAWVGLRGAVPIYLSIIPALADPTQTRLFGSVFILVVASLIVQGWSIGWAAQLVGYKKSA
jgi:cell volume regulation protein A